jgi:hypothetical protein
MNDRIRGFIDIPAFPWRGEAAMCVPAERQHATIEIMCGPTCGCGKTYRVPNDGELHRHPCPHCAHAATQAKFNT